MASSARGDVVASTVPREQIARRPTSIPPRCTARPGLWIYRCWLRRITPALGGRNQGGSGVGRGHAPTFVLPVVELSVQSPTCLAAKVLHDRRSPDGSGSNRSHRHKWWKEASIAFHKFHKWNTLQKASISATSTLQAAKRRARCAQVRRNRSGTSPCCGLRSP